MKINIVIFGNDESQMKKILEKICQVFEGNVLSSKLWLLPDLTEQRWETITKEIAKAAEVEKPYLLALKTTDVFRFHEKNSNGFLKIFLHCNESLENIDTSVIDLFLDAFEDYEALAHIVRKKYTAMGV
jgi:hypothetical protein